MLARGTIVLAVLTWLLAAAVASAQVTIESRIDVIGLQAAGQADWTATAWDIGSPRDVFDGNTATLYRSANINPAQITLEFNAAERVSRFRVMCAGGTTRWRIETADTLDDLNSASGSYHLFVDWVTTPNETLTDIVPPAARLARVIRLTANRIVGDDFVHIREWDLYSSATITGVTVSPKPAAVRAGATVQFSCIGAVQGGGTRNLTEVVAWSSSNPAAAMVNAAGEATGLSAGQSDITATLAPLSDSSRLTVSAEPTDLNVTLISRTPEYAYDASKNRPAPGDAVTFTARVRSWGSATIASVPYQWQVDGQPAGGGTLTNLNAGDERLVALPWVWQAGPHTVRFVVDPADAVAELSESNNAIEVRTDAILVGFWVEQSVYNHFRQRQRDLNIGSNSWEDWAQRQMAWWNELSAAAVWPLSPDGVLDRVAIDSIIVVPDGALPLAGGLATNNPDLRDRTVDLMWGFPASLLNGNIYANTTAVEPWNAFYRESSLLHELGHARYLIDNYGFDTHNTAHNGGHDSVRILENGMPVAGSPLMPFVAFGEVLYYNKSGGVMSGPYGFAWSPYEAAALNLIAGRRAQCGNYNSPCNIGVFLQDLPLRNHLTLRLSDGRPMKGADVRVYRAGPGPGWYGKTIDNTPDAFYTTDADGRILLPRNPFNPGGNIVHTFGHANGVLVLRVSHAAGLFYRFLEVTDFNMAYWSGQTQDAHYELVLPGSVCAADFNQDGFLDLFDFDEFVGCFEGGPCASSDPRAADFDGDGFVDFFDYDAFVSAFEVGC